MRHPKFTGCCGADDEEGSKRLKDVHHGLPPSGMQNGTLHMVEGSYDYHHYMQVCSHTHRGLLRFDELTLEHLKHREASRSQNRESPDCCKASLREFGAAACTAATTL